MSGLNFNDDENQIVPTRSGRSKTAPRRKADDDVDDKEKKEKSDEKRKKPEKNLLPLWIGLGVGGGLLLVGGIVLAEASPGRRRLGTIQQLHRQGLRGLPVESYAADFYRKSKTPTAKQIAEVEKRLKNVKPGTVADFRQGLRILNEHRDLEDYLLETQATSEFVRSTFFSVFGNPSDTPTKAPFEKMKIWHHRCSDGSIEMLGVMQIESNPEYMKILPPKKHGNS